jgi:hypothetical protein
MIIFILLLLLIIAFLYFTRTPKRLEKFNDNDYLKTLDDIENIFIKNPKYQTLKNDKDFQEAIHNFKLIHDFNTSLELDIKNKQEILYCNIPPDAPDLCRGFRILPKQQYDMDRLKQKLESTKASIIKAIIGKLNVIYNETNDNYIKDVQETFTAQIDYLIHSILQYK